jgi:hypothetical protein
MFRKVVTTSILGLLLAGTLVSVAPAQAATKIVAKNGVLCTKSGLKTKVGTNVYTCQKNPIVNKTKLTWVWSGCIEAQAAYLKSQTAYASLAASYSKNSTDTKAAADALALVMIDSINKMIEYKGNKDYLRGDTVWVKDLGYFTANAATIPIDRTGASAPKVSNTGAVGSLSLWTVFVPSGPSALSPKFNLTPSPELAIAERKADISHWADAIKALNADAQKLKAAKTLTAAQLATLNAIPSYINSLSTGSTAASNTITNMESNISRLKRLNSSQTTLALAQAQLAGAKMDISTNLSMRNQACAKNL